MNSAICLLTSILLLSPFYYTADQPDWESDVDTYNQSIRVIGTSTRTPSGKQSLRPRLSKDEIDRQRLIAKYGLEEVQALENGTHDNLNLMLLTDLPGQNPPHYSNLLTITDLATLGINSTNITLQPSRGWAYVNKPVYLQSNTHPITTTKTILNTTVTITATPTSYTWNTGDNQNFTTKDPGAPWPNGTLTHTYTHPGTYTLTANTTWSATYTINGHTYPIDGTLTTTSTPHTIKIIEAEAVLTH